MSSPADQADGEYALPARGQAIYLYAIARAQRWRGRRIRHPAGTQPIHVRYRDLEAIGRVVAWEQPRGSEAELRAHQQVVAAALRHGTVLPFPYGVVFRGRRPLIRLLQEQYLVIDAALSFVDGAAELRLHVTRVAPTVAAAGPGDPAVRCYAELRRHARAALLLPRDLDGERRLAAAFLVERAAVGEFRERAADLGSAHPELTIAVTGPWPPYDFIRVSR